MEQRGDEQCIAEIPTEVERSSQLSKETSLPIGGDFVSGLLPRALTSDSHALQSYDGALTSVDLTMEQNASTPKHTADKCEATNRRAAQVNFMDALGSIADAHGMLVAQFQQQRKLGEIWSEAYDLDAGRISELSSSIARIEARMAEHDDAEKRITALGNKFDMRIDAMERKQVAQAEDAMSQLLRKHEDLSASLTHYCNKTASEAEERARGHTRRVQESMTKRSDTIETLVRESIEAHIAQVDSKLQGSKDELSAQVQELAVQITSCQQNLKPMAKQISDIDNRVVQQHGQYERLAESLERFALASQIPPLDLRIRNTERDLFKLTEKHVALEERLVDENKRLRTDLEIEVGSRKALDGDLALRLAGLDKLIDDFKERVGSRFDTMQDDLSASREWSVKKFEAQAEFLRGLSQPGRATDSQGGIVTNAVTLTTSAPGDGNLRGDLAEMQRRFDELGSWRHDIDQFLEQDFSRTVDNVRRLSSLVEDKTAKLLAMEQSIQEMMMEAQRVLDYNVAATTKCLSCGSTAAARAAAVESHPRSISPGCRRSQSPPMVQSLADVTTTPYGFSSRQPSTEGFWPHSAGPSSPSASHRPSSPTTSGHRPRSRPGSARSRNDERSHIIGSATCSIQDYLVCNTPQSTAVSPQVPVGGGVSAARSQSARNRRPQSATARLGDKTKKTIA